MQRIYTIIALLLVCMAAYPQKAERKNLREGNKLYEKESYTESEIAYRKALDVDAKSPEATYNLGNSLYRQEKGKDALSQYQGYLANESDPLKQAAAWHNIGNVCMQAQDYANAVQSYKQSLLKNPKDDETRYNLAMAQALLKKQQQQQQQQQEQNKDQQEQQKDQQEQQEQQQQQEQQNQDKQEQQDQQQQEQQQEQISQEKAQQLLDALMQDEEEVQEKVKKLQMQNAQRTHTDKDW